MGAGLPDICNSIETVRGSGKNWGNAMFKSFLKNNQKKQETPKGEGSRPLQKAHFSSRRLNVLAEKLGAKSYLEIGVHRGRTFFHTSVAMKHAVDPKFKFDPAEFEDETTRFFAMTSDDYFRNHADGQKFDLVFLDGLHVFEQTFRDFCSALTLTHDRSVIIIDDTYPSDVYSACPDLAGASLRDQYGGTGRGWHGDIFKMIFAIHDFFPMLSYATINTGGNPQTLVWRQARQDFKPVLNSLEGVSRMTWFDLQRHLDTMNFIEEKAGLDRVVAALADK